MRIISGGQTGVDRAALDAALESGIEAGGWCPEGRKAEDGAIPKKYPVQVLKNAGYLQRTQKNAVNSDGTVIIYFGYPTGGTEQTMVTCIREKKPYLLIDAQELSIERAAKRTKEFITIKKISTLNVAGPRANGEPSAYAYTRRVLSNVFK